VERIGVIGLGEQNSPINRLRFCRAAIAMMLNGDLEFPIHCNAPTSIPKVYQNRVVRVRTETITWSSHLEIVNQPAT